MKTKGTSTELRAIDSLFCLALPIAWSAMLVIVAVISCIVETGPGPVHEVLSQRVKTDIHTNQSESLLLRHAMSSRSVNT